MHYDRKLVVDSNPIRSKYDRREEFIFICKNCHTKCGIYKFKPLLSNDSPKMRIKDKGRPMSIDKFNQALDNYPVQYINCEFSQNQFVCNCGAKYKTNSKSEKDIFNVQFEVILSALDS